MRLWVLALALALAVVLTSCQRAPRVAVAPARSLPAAALPSDAGPPERARHAATTTATADDPERPGDDPFTPLPLRGPFPALDDYCRTLPAGTTCDPDSLADGETLDRPAPFLAVRRLNTEADDQHWRELAVRTARGWFVSRKLVEAGHSQGPAGSSSLGTRSLRIEPALQLLVIESDHGHAAREDLPDDPGGGHGHRYFSSCERALVVCGMGASGVPSCTADITVSLREVCQGDVQRRSPGDYRLTVSLTQRTLSLHRFTGTPDRRLLGRHPLTFP